jgi:2-(3-amino-3-carboxypropyl)histidine synthase
MKVLYIESKLKNKTINLAKSEINKLPKNLFIAYSIQYKDLAYNIAKQLKSNNIKVKQIKQVLGCTDITINLPILLIASGRFHANNLLLQSDNIYVLENNKIIKLQESDINKLKANRKTALIKYLSANNIGILVSTKPGQENLNQAIKLKKELQKQNKSVYIFVSDNIDTAQFENFNIDSWVNTACPGMAYDNSDIININELP